LSCEFCFNEFWIESHGNFPKALSFTLPATAMEILCPISWPVVGNMDISSRFHETSGLPVIRPERRVFRSSVSALAI
jgi:hypothetical protein